VEKLQKDFKKLNEEERKSIDDISKELRAKVGPKKIITVDMMLQAAEKYGYSGGDIGKWMMSKTPDSFKKKTFRGVDVNKLNSLKVGDTVRVRSDYPWGRHGGKTYKINRMVPNGIPNPFMYVVNIDEPLDNGYGRFQFSLEDIEKVSDEEKSLERSWKADNKNVPNESKMNEEDLFPNASEEEVRSRGEKVAKDEAEALERRKQLFNSLKVGEAVRTVDNHLYDGQIGRIIRKEIRDGSVYNFKKWYGVEVRFHEQQGHGKDYFNSYDPAWFQADELEKVS
jgi:hypothetical protein